MVTKRLSTRAVWSKSEEARESKRGHSEREEVKKTIGESIKICKMYPYAKYSKLELAIKLI